jgi:hypothetical protein
MKISEMNTPYLFKIKDKNFLSGLPEKDGRICMNTSSGELEVIPMDVETQPSDFSFRYHNGYID